MRIIVCVKQVPDTEAKLVIGPSGVAIEDRDITFILNPYDEYAVEEAVRIKEKLGGATSVTLVTVGPPRSEDALRLGLAMGAERALRVWADGLENADGWITATVLEAIARREGFDLILCGRVAIDDASGEVALRLAERLGVPHVNAVTSLSVADGGGNGSVTAESEAEGGRLVVTVDLPAVVTAQKGLNEPRYPAIPAIMKARRMEIETSSLEDLALAETNLQAKTRLITLTEPPPRKAGRIVQADTPEEAAGVLAEFLRDEAKVL